MGGLKLVDGRRPAFYPGRQQSIQAGIDIEIAAGQIGSGRGQLADAAGSGPTRAGQVEHQPPGQQPGQAGQVGVGGLGHARQQIKGLIRIGREQIVEGLLIELAQFGGDVGETVAALEVAAADGAPPLLLERVVGVFSGQDLLVVGTAALRLSTFPEPGSWLSSYGTSEWTGSMNRRQSSVMISSGERDDES